MDLSKILSISGKPGLYKLVGEAKNNLVVESLTDGKRVPAFPHEQISSLKEISIYTASEDVPLEDVFKKIYEIHEGKQIENPKKMNSNDLKSFFEKVLPDYDKEAVYTSDIKKVFTWYNQLLSKNLISFNKEKTSTEKPENDNKESGEKITE